MKKKYFIAGEPLRQYCLKRKISYAAACWRINNKYQTPEEAVKSLRVYKRKGKKNVTMDI